MDRCKKERPKRLNKMRFSDKSSPFLSLQKKHGKFWVDKIGASEKMQEITFNRLKDRVTTSGGWHEQSSKMLRDIFNNYDKFENVYLCKPVVKKIEDLEISTMSNIKRLESCLTGLVSIGDKFGCFLLSSDISLVYGLYPDGIVYAMFIDDKITSAECTITGGGASIREWGVSSFAIDAQKMFPGSGITTESVSFLGWLINALTIYYFAEIETKIVGGKEQKKAVVANEKVLNETGVPVKIVDCRWFTNIIRTDGFAVRGHFRLQPKKKDGEWTRELIWINDFEKHGYTSKARILNQ